ncbi:hypothetical protein C9927_02220 [Pseudidiomarina aestuarii]|uniref:PIN domain-containing protein n=1 Tax=Pseudidiomarina aestuarii TaxID=624146 RepID=A0A2T4D679_9GAMM|nr:hypothetical protein C9928_04780 [Pseudidiomarina aestuarii]PTB89252.1 hypothetical protein C9927_02220 [Pseudidiomarina aestuarii]
MNLRTAVFLLTIILIRETLAMHRSLDQLGRIVLIDTNVLLNGCFVEQSAASFSVRWLQESGYSLMIDKSVEEEASRILNTLQTKLKLDYNPIQVLRAYVKFMNIVTVKSTDLTRSRYINRADQHVFSAAMQFHAWILTADIKFAAELQQTKCDCRLPSDIVMETLTKDDNKQLINYMFRFIGLVNNRGSIFARVTPGSWAGQSKIGRFIVCEIENVARLYYDTDSCEWVFKTKLNSELRIHCNLETRDEWLLSASYEFSIQNGRGNIVLRGKSRSGLTIHGSTVHLGVFPAKQPGR